jgi:hypothetical protein
MKAVTRIQTFDGQLHETEYDAKNHVERIYGELLSSIAHKLVRIEKYTAMCDFVDANLDLFTQLSAIKADLLMVEDN